MWETNIISLLFKELYLPESLKADVIKLYMKLLRNGKMMQFFFSKLRTDSVENLVLLACIYLVARREKIPISISEIKSAVERIQGRGEEEIVDEIGMYFFFFYMEKIIWKIKKTLKIALPQLDLKDYIKRYIFILQKNGIEISWREEQELLKLADKIKDIYMSKNIIAIALIYYFLRDKITQVKLSRFFGVSIPSIRKAYYKIAEKIREEANNQYKRTSSSLLSRTSRNF